MDNKVDLVLISDNNYIMQLYITLISLKASKNSDSFYKIYLVLMNVTENNKKEILKLRDNNFELNIIEKNITKITNFDNTYINNYSIAIFFKLELDEILKNLDKVLFLDCDIIVTKDLSSLYNIDMSTYYLAGCKDITPIIHHIKIYNKYYGNYFNVGVLLLNLKLIRQDAFFYKVRNYYLTQGNNFMFPEQDALNNIIGDKVKILPPKYNWITTNKNYTKNQLSKFYGIDSKDIKDKNIVIFHYAGIKPWEFYPSFYGKYWEYYYKKSPFYKKTLKRNKKYSWFIRFCALVKNQIRIYKNKELYKEANII